MPNRCAQRARRRGRRARPAALAQRKAARPKRQRCARQPAEETRMNAKQALAVAISLMAACAGTARADATADLQKQMEFLQHELDAVKTQLYNMQQEKAKEAAAAPKGNV